MRRPETLISRMQKATGWQTLGLTPMGSSPILPMPLRGRARTAASPRPPRPTSPLSTKPKPPFLLSANSGDLASAHVNDLPDGTYRFAPFARNAASLDARAGGTANGTPVQIYASNDTDAQVWKVTHDADGYVIITNLKSGLVLDLPAASTSNGTKLQLWTSNNTLAQRWIAVAQSDGSIVLLSAADPTKALDLPAASTADNTPVQLYTANNTKAQRWTFEKAQSKRERIDALALAHKDDVTVDLSYYLAPKTNPFRLLSATSSKLVDPSGGRDCCWIVNAGDSGPGYVYLTSSANAGVLTVKSSAAGNAVATEVTPMKEAGNFAQEWILAKQGDGSVKIISALDDSFVLDLPAASTSLGTGAQIYEDNGTGAQRWNFMESSELYAPVDDLAAKNKGTLEDGTYSFVSALPGNKVVDLKDGSRANGANVQMWASNGSDAQRWEVSSSDDGYLTITNVASGKPLDVSAGKALPGANVQQYEANGSRAQQWIAVAEKNGVQLVSALWPNLSLDISAASTQNGANVQIWESNGSAAQTFKAVKAAKVEPCEDTIPANSWFALHPGNASDKAVDISAAQIADGANAQIWQSNGSFAQLFTFRYVDGYYQIINANSGKALDVQGGSMLPGTNVQQWAPDAKNPNQLFAAVEGKPLADGIPTYVFTNKGTGLALDVVAAGTANGTNLDAYTPNQTKAQSFALEERSNLIKEGIYTIGSSLNVSSLLDVASASVNDGANVQIWSSNGTFSQRWRITLVEGRENTYTIESLASSKRLAVNTSGNVVQSKAVSDATQWWIPSVDANGIEFENVKTGRVLDVAAAGTANGTNVQTYAANGTAAQRFRLVQSDASVPNGTYMVRVASSPFQALDVAGGSVGNGANVQAWATNSSAAQAWKFTREADGTYSIVNAGSGKMLDVKDAVAASGANVQQWEGNGSAAQRWRITYAEGGFRIASALDDNLVLDIWGGNAFNGANVQIYKDNGTAAQRFLLSTTNYIPSIVNSARWIGASYFTPGRQGNDWQAIVIHISECPTLGAIDNTFTDGGRRASAHYGVGGTQIHQYVNLGDTAWAVGNWNWNLRTVSIEHVGTTNNAPSYTTLDTSAQLMAGLARMKGWPSLVLGQNVGIHKWYSSTDCPGPLDYTWLIKRANEYLGSNTDGSYVDGAAVPRGRSVAGVSALWADLSGEAA